LRVPKALSSGWEWLGFSHVFGIMPVLGFGVLGLWLRVWSLWFGVESLWVRVWVVGFVFWGRILGLTGLAFVVWSFGF